MRVEVLNRSLTGLALGLRAGMAGISPAVAHTGHLWWKKQQDGYAVQVTELQYDNCGGYVDCYCAWRNRGFWGDRAAAEAFVRDIQNTGLASNG